MTDSQIRKPLDEATDRELLQSWYDKARAVRTPADLQAFATYLLTEFQHDYGTIVHACAAMALAGVCTVDHDESQGGITGFQAGCVMWQFISKFMHYEDQPLRMLKYEELLFPQYDYGHFTITKSTMEWLQQRAKKELEEVATKKEFEEADPFRTKLLQRWKMLAEGQLPPPFQLEEEKARD